MSRSGLKERREKLFSVFVGHIHPEVQKDELKTLFSGCGKVDDLCIMQNEGNSPYVYGFVRFGVAEHARRAVRELNGWPLRSSALIVDYSKDSRDRLLKDEPKAVREDRQGLQVVSPGSVYADGYRPRCVDKLTNTARVKEACSLINVEYLKSNSAPVRVVQLMEKIEGKGGALKHPYDAKKAVKMTSSSASYRLVVKDVADELREWETNGKGTVSPIADTYLSKVEEIRATVASFLGKAPQKPMSTHSTSSQNRMGPNKRDQDNAEKSKESSQSKKEPEQIPMSIRIRKAYLKLRNESMQKGTAVGNKESAISSPQQRGTEQTVVRSETRLNEQSPQPRRPTPVSHAKPHNSTKEGRSRKGASLQDSPKTSLLSALSKIASKPPQFPPSLRQTFPTPENCQPTMIMDVRACNSVVPLGSLDSCTRSSKRDKQHGKRASHLWLDEGMEEDFGPSECFGLDNKKKYEKMASDLFLEMMSRS